MRFLLVVLLLSIVSCSNESKKHTPTESTKTNLCRHSKYLSIYKVGEGYQIRIQHPDKEDKHFQLTVSAPAKHLAVLSATHIGMLSALNQEKRIAAITDIRYVYSPNVKKQFKQKRIVELQNEQTMSVDQLLHSKSEYLIYSAFSGSFSQEKRLEKLGIQCIPDFDWREQSALGRAEWILLFQSCFEKVLCNVSGIYNRHNMYFMNYQGIKPEIKKKLKILYNEIIKTY